MSGVSKDVLRANLAVAEHTPAHAVWLPAFSIGVSTEVRTEAGALESKAYLLATAKASIHGLQSRAWVTRPEE